MVFVQSGSQWHSRSKPRVSISRAREAAGDDSRRIWKGCRLWIIPLSLQAFPLESEMKEADC